MLRHAVIGTDAMRDHRYKRLAKAAVAGMKAARGNARESDRGRGNLSPASRTESVTWRRSMQEMVGTMANEGGGGACTCAAFVVVVVVGRGRTTR